MNKGLKGNVTMACIIYTLDSAKRELVYKLTEQHFFKKLAQNLGFADDIVYYITKNI